ncbi:MAG TPA: NAD(P)-dependent oxidoreductase [Gemmatimonadaceae bacterium]|nr:NAD(P)-dependent oxidoreductase [Gemmatimonadaceae bacterium]
MKLCITGGAGFLGYHLAELLGGSFDEIVLIDIAPLPEPPSRPNVRYVQADVRDSRAMSSVFEGCSLAVHAAAALPLWKAKEIFDINVLGLRNTLDAAVGAGTRKCVVISSTAVYGIPETHPIDESARLVGVGPYGASKIQAEKICLEYRDGGRISVPVLRPKTFIGTGRMGVFQILYDWVRSGKRIPIIGTGENRYQLLEVEDLVQAILLLLRDDSEKSNDTFNVGAEDFSTVREDVTALCVHAKTNARVMLVPAALAKPALRLFEKLGISPLYQWIYDTADKDSYVSSAKIRETLGWSPQYSNQAALIRSYEWYCRHYGDTLETGVTHRVAWKQGILGWIKKLA